MLEPAANLILIGARASGKSSLGRRLAARLAREFVDLDDILADSAGQPVDALLRERGEPAFRALETEVLKRAAALSGCVIATGGGAVLHGEDFARLAATGRVVYLQASFDVLLERQRETPRAALRAGPLADEIRQLLAEREPIYRALADITVSVEVAEPILAILHDLGEG